MKTGECIKLVNPDGEGSYTVDWLTIWKESKGKYKVVLEKNSRIKTKELESSAEVRKIVKAAEKLGYKKTKGSVELDEKEEC